MLRVCEDSEIERPPQSAAGAVCNLTHAVWKDRWLLVGQRDKREGKWRGEKVNALAVSCSDQINIQIRDRRERETAGHCGQTSYS